MSRTKSRRCQLRRLTSVTTGLVKTNELGRDRCYQCPITSEHSGRYFFIDLTLSVNGRGSRWYLNTGGEWSTSSTHQQYRSVRVIDLSSRRQTQRILCWWAGPFWHGGGLIKFEFEWKEIAMFISNFVVLIWSRQKKIRAQFSKKILSLIPQSAALWKSFVHFIISSRRLSYSCVSQMS